LDHRQADAGNEEPDDQNCEVISNGVLSAEKDTPRCVREVVEGSDVSVAIDYWEDLNGENGNGEVAYDPEEKEEWHKVDSKESEKGFKSKTTGQHAHEVEHPEDGESTMAELSCKVDLERQAVEGVHKREPEVRSNRCRHPKSNKRFGS